MFSVNNKKGMTLAEILIGVSILLVALLGLISSYNRYFKASVNTIPLMKSSYLLEEGIEAVKTLRDTSWSAQIAPLSTTTTYYLVFSTASSTWNATSTMQIIDTNFYRTINVSDIRRDSNSDISTSTGAYDSNTKKITVTVSWLMNNATTTQQLATYISNIFSN